jgi:hypothetical protein
MTTNDAPLNWPSDDEIPAWLRGKTIDELHAIEHNGRVLFPEALRRRDEKGRIIETPCLVAIPTDAERAMGRLDAVARVATITKKKPTTIEDARALIGADVFENLDTFGILARCILEPTPPHGRAYLLDVLVETFPPSTLFELYGRLDMLAKLWSPQLDELTEERFWTLVVQIAKVRNLSPLAGIGGLGQVTCVLRMAQTLYDLRTRRHFSPSNETSTPAS